MALGTSSIMYRTFALAMADPPSSRSGGNAAADPEPSHRGFPHRRNAGIRPAAARGRGLLQPACKALGPWRRAMSADRTRRGHALNVVLAVSMNAVRTGVGERLSFQTTWV